MLGVFPLSEKKAQIKPFSKQAEIFVEQFQNKEAAFR
jgi:hypothetical protein